MLTWTGRFVLGNGNGRWETIGLASEALDVELERWLLRMLARADANRTVILLGSDHGLQGGPTTMEFATQMEQRRPWTTLLLPEALLDADGASTLRRNQQRLVTGFDLYHTLLGLMDPVPDAPDDSEQFRGSDAELNAEIRNAFLTCLEREPDPSGQRSYFAAIRDGMGISQLRRELSRSAEGRASGARQRPACLGSRHTARLAPRWAFDLVHEAVPAGRSCAEAMVPVDFCGCANEFAEESGDAYPKGSPHRHKLGICNFIDDRRHYCVAAET